MMKPTNKNQTAQTTLIMNYLPGHINKLFIIPGNLALAL